MPVKRRTAKRRVDSEREYQIWSAIFDCGFDLFGEAQELGLPIEWSEDVPPEMAREPWARLGERWLADPNHSNRLHPIWAEELFGRPWEIAA